MKVRERLARRYKIHNESKGTMTEDLVEEELLRQLKE
jgi:hypothetical protein